jgi:poly-beta-1,6-N-acetyl-D-glucosamine synthase
VIILYILLSLFIVATICHLIYLLFYFSKLASYVKKENDQESKLPVSIIIAARNESQNLLRNLPYFFQQDYPSYEVIVVNDCSYDGSTEILKDFKKSYPNLKVVEIEENDRFKHGKKFALTLGIKAAENKHLLLTDADCVPASVNWIHSMQASFRDKDIVLGYSPYKKYKGFLNAIIRFETFYTGMQYLSIALKGKPYMGVGRNLAYTKDIFFQNKGFASHMHILSGDDDLFINQVATPENVSVNIDPESFVITEPKKKFSEYFKQKLRHLSTGKEYKASDKLHLVLISSSGLLFYIFLLLLIIFNFNLKVTLAFFAVKLIVSGVIYYKVMKKLHCADLWWYYPFLDLLYYLTMPVWAIIGYFRKQRKWK